LDYARFKDIFSEASPWVTYEGDKSVLMLQAAFILIKEYNKFIQNPNKARH